MICGFISLHIKDRGLPNQILIGLDYQIIITRNVILGLKEIR